MKFGVNYTPSHGWFHAWLDPDWDGIDNDLKQISELGMDHVRIFPIWPYLQPNRTWINKKGVADVRRMVHIAGEHGLDAYVDVFQGHLSSFDFLPSWLVTWHAGNMFTDADAVAAERELVKTMTDELSKEPAFKGLTLGNEVNQLSDRPHPTKMSATSQQIDAWLNALLPAVAGEGHNALYLAELAKAFGKDSERPVWLQEVGAPENALETDYTPEFCRKTVERAMDCRNLWGVTWWCSHDVPASMEDFPFFEHSLGLFDEQGQLKPIGRTFGELAAQYRSALPAQPKTVAVVVDVDEAGNPVNRSALGPGGSVCDLWMKLQVAGQRPTIITSQVAADQAELARRGILELHADEHPYAARYYTAVSDPSFETAD